MTDEVFTASNGVTVTIGNRGCLIAKGGRDGMTTYATAGAHFGVQALREYFQHKRDQELGRWRDPENPDMVVYPMGGAFDELWVFNEKDPSEYESWTREEVDTGVYPLVFGYDTAKRYFDAHPETKPWHDAKTGELWKVTVAGDTGLALATEAHRHGTQTSFLFANETLYKVTSKSITHAEKIYPREDKK